MRLVAILLLLANVGLVAWILHEPESAADAGQTDLPTEVGELVLLEEISEEETPAAIEDACYTLGPFDDTTQVEAAGELLDEMGIEARSRVLVDEETYGYQVYLPSFDSREAAVVATQELSSQGIHDHFIMSEPDDLRYAVSLGLFSEQRHARSHQGYLRDQGFESELRVRTRDRERYWQDYEDPDGQVSRESFVSLAGDRPLQRLHRDCE